MYLQSCSLRLKLPFLLFYAADELCMREQKIRRRSIISRKRFKVSHFMEDVNLCLFESCSKNIQIKKNILRKHFRELSGEERFNFIFFAEKSQ